ncbi:MAG: hypothetical protein ACJATT_003121 [Myxococcota bacterium]|jgi:hypothetical protein
MSPHIPSIRMANPMKTHGAQLLLSLVLPLPAVIVPPMLRTGLLDRQIVEQTDITGLLADGLAVCVVANKIFAGLLSVSAVLALGCTASKRRSWIATSISFETVAASLGAASVSFLAASLVYIGMAW